MVIWLRVVVQTLISCAEPTPIVESSQVNESSINVLKQSLRTSIGMMFPSCGSIVRKLIATFQAMLCDCTSPRRTCSDGLRPPSPMVPTMGMRILAVSASNLRGTMMVCNLFHVIMRWALTW